LHALIPSELRLLRRPSLQFQPSSSPAVEELNARKQICLRKTNKKKNFKKRRRIRPKGEEEEKEKKLETKECNDV